MTKVMTDKQKKKWLAIVEAAIEIFSEKGFHNTKIVEVAKKAEVADGTVYLYFKNKDDLLITAFQYLFKNRLEFMKEKLDEISDPLLRLHSFFKLHIDYYKNFPHELRFSIIELRQSPQFYQKFPDFLPMKGYIDFIKQLCISCAEAKDIKNVNMDILATMLYGIMDFALTEWALGYKEYSLEEITNTVIDILHNGLKLEN